MDSINLMGLNSPYLFFKVTNGINLFTSKRLPMCQNRGYQIVRIPRELSEKVSIRPKTYAIVQNRYFSKKQRMALNDLKKEEYILKKRP